MSKRKHFSVSAIRKIAILKRSETGCLFNHKWCFALTTEPAAKWLIDHGMIVLTRRYMTPRSARTIGHITKQGRDFLKKKMSHSSIG